MLNKNFFLIGLLFFALTQSLTAQVVINEVRYLGTDEIELKNTGSLPVDVSSWQLCALFSYIAINDISLTVTGNTMMQSGDIITIVGWPLDDAGSDFGLYSSSNFTDTAAMRSFTQWGTTGNGRESVAVAKGIWTVATTVPLVASSSSSIEYRGPAIGVSEWYEATTPSFGAENGILDCTGGTVSTLGGVKSFYCKESSGGDGPLVNMDSSGTSSDKYAYVVTDDMDMILGAAPADIVDVTDALVGECHVWGVSYTGTLSATRGESITQTILSDSCYNLSSNFVTIIRDSVDGGSIETSGGEDSVFVCFNGGTPLGFRFTVEDTTGRSTRLIVTDPAGVILGLPPGDSVDFSGAGIGECWVWNLSYSGTSFLLMGDSLFQTALSDSCYDLSENYVVVLRDTSGAACSPTAISPDLFSQHFQLYPNPASDRIVLDWDGQALSGAFSVRIYELSGKLSLQRQFTSAQALSGMRSLDVSVLNAGVYVLEVQDAHSAYRTKLILR